MICGAGLDGSASTGALQFGGKLGTLNGIIGVALLATPFSTDGSGFAQGGSPY